jgi:hypothetical protein
MPLDASMLRSRQCPAPSRAARLPTVAALVLTVAVAGPLQAQGCLDIQDNGILNCGFSEESGFGSWSFPPESTPERDTETFRSGPAALQVTGGSSLSFGLCVGATADTVYAFGIWVRADDDTLEFCSLQAKSWSRPGCYLGLGSPSFPTGAPVDSFSGGWDLAVGFISAPPGDFGLTDVSIELEMTCEGPENALAHFDDAFFAPGPVLLFSNGFEVHDTPWSVTVDETP